RVRCDTADRLELVTQTRSVVELQPVRVFDQLDERLTRPDGCNADTRAPRRRRQRAKYVESPHPDRVTAKRPRAAIDAEALLAGSRTDSVQLDAVVAKRREHIRPEPDLGIARNDPQSAGVIVDQEAVVRDQRECSPHEARAQGRLALPGRS